MTIGAETVAEIQGTLQAHLSARRAAGSKLLVAYVTGGLPVGGGSSWAEVVRAVVDAGADSVEVGIPFSDPVMDGPVIQEASRRALAAGTTPRTLLGEIPGDGLAVGVPLAVMTYYNIVHAFGLGRFAGTLAQSGVSAAIVPDLPLEESGPWREAARSSGIETVMLAAPTTPDDRLVRICEASAGFVYGVGLMGVTGTRDELAGSAVSMARRLKAVTDKPVLIGVGVSNGEQARAASEVADGVVVGSAVIRTLLDGGGPAGAAQVVGEIRAALDAS